MTAPDITAQEILIALTTNDNPLLRALLIAQKPVVYMIKSRCNDVKYQKWERTRCPRHFLHERDSDTLALTYIHSVVPAGLSENDTVGHFCVMCGMEK
jgi:hypothetical protein